MSMSDKEREAKSLAKGGSIPGGRELSDTELDGVAGGVKQEPPKNPPGGPGEKKP
jgi:hypothetical protein